MRKLLYMIEFVFILIVSIMCSINNFIAGCISIGNYNMIMGTTKIILSLSLLVLIVSYYQFYKLIKNWV